MLIQHDGRRIRYDLTGPRGAPVVCFAHALAADSGMWAEQLPAVWRAGYRCLAVDMRGHGGSEATQGDYRLDMLADDIDAVLTANAIDAVHFIGLSIGAMIGQAFALRRPEKTLTLLLCEAPPASLKNAQTVWGPRVRAVEEAGTLAPIAEKTMKRWLTEAFKRRQPERWKQIFDTVAATTPDGYRGCVAALSHFDFTADLPRVDAPALIICGEDDPATSIEENERLASLLPRGRFHRFSSARHLPNVEDPERFNAILINWLTEHM